VRSAGANNSVAMFSGRVRLEPAFRWARQELQVCAPRYRAWAWKKRVGMEGCLLLVGHAFWDRSDCSARGIVGIPSPCRAGPFPGRSHASWPTAVTREKKVLGRDRLVLAGHAGASGLLSGAVSRISAGALWSSPLQIMLLLWAGNSGGKGCSASAGHYTAVPDLPLNPPKLCSTLRVKHGRAALWVKFCLPAVRCSHLLSRGRPWPPRRVRWLFHAV